MSDTARILAAIEAIHNVVAPLPGRLDTLDARLDTLGGRLDTLDREVAGLRADLSSTRAEIMARIDRLQEVLVVQRDEQMVNLGAAERAERIARQAHEEMLAMAEQVTTLLRLIHRLSTRVDHLEGMD